MAEVLKRFVAWSHSHAGAPCPDVSQLGEPVLDPWGTPIAITCADQPANQIVGAISSGADRAIGTVDDIGSWQLGRDVTDLVHGPRWTATRPAKATPARPRAPRPKPDDDDIPTER
jgi:hypothetical protein